MSTEENIPPSESIGKKKLIVRIFEITLLFLIITGFTIMAIRLISSELEPGNRPLKLQKDPAALNSKSRRGTYMRLKNLNFRLTDRIQMKVDHLNAEAIPRRSRSIVNFDDIHSFAIDIYHGEVYVPIRTLEIIFNEIVFNYDGASLKNLKIDFIDKEVDGRTEKRILLSGDMKLVLWIGFEMEGRMLLDKDRVLMIIEAEKITSLGNPMTKSMLDVVGLDLQKLIPVPDGRGVRMKENRIIIEPFEIFPPPKIGGYITDIKMVDKSLYLKFDNEYKIKFPPMPIQDAKNYLFLNEGKVKFGKLRMFDARLQMIDMDSSDPFDFYLKKYFGPLSKGYSKIRRDGSVIAFFPDYDDSLK